MDEVQRQINKITPAGQIIVKGIPYFGFDIAPDVPIHIQQKSGYVYVSQPNNHIQVFDIFGKWIRSLAFDDFKSIVYIDKSIYIHAGNQIIEAPLEISFKENLHTIQLNGFSGITFDVSQKRFYGISTDYKIFYLVTSQ